VFYRCSVIVLLPVEVIMADAFDDSPVVMAELPHIKLFGKWSSEDVNHSDMSLAVSVIIVICLTTVCTAIISNK